MKPTSIGPHGVRFDLWAPRLRRMTVETAGDRFPLERQGDGWFSGTLPGLVPGDRYRYVLDERVARPDPCARFLPDGVHGWSALVDPAAFRWEQGAWEGVAKRDLVIYEIHVGTFTRPGTYEAALQRLDHLLALGATAVELLPLAQAPGRWNWGYDGVGLHAPNHNYGTPDDLRRFVDVCHRRGLAVILDVVYNHFGPEGNYLAEFAPFFSRRHDTPWGPMPDFGKRPVRDFVVGNAIHWLEEYRFDGLRLDAVRLMRDDGEPHILHEIEAAVHGWATGRGYPVHLIAEANVHDPALLDGAEEAATYDLLWNDEIPHAFFSATLGQHRIDQRTYRGSRDLGRALSHGFVFARDREGVAIIRDEISGPAELESMVQGLQTHDQVGNHPEGLRLHQVASPELQRTGAALLLLHPAVPLCFMGEEFAAPTPFCFFADFEDTRLREAVVAGRKEAYHQHDWGRFPCPLEEQTFLRSKLGSPDEGDPGMLTWYRALLALRRDWIRAGVLRAGRLQVRCDEASGFVTLDYGQGFRVLANPGPGAVPVIGLAGMILHSAWRQFGGERADGAVEDPELPARSAAVCSG